MSTVLEGTAATGDVVTLSVSLSNPKTKAASLYSQQANTLTLTFANDGDKEVRFASGADKSVIRIGFAGLLTASEVGQMTVDDGWTSQARPTRRATVLELRPGRDITLPAHQSLTLTLTVPGVAAKPTSDTVHIEYTNITGANDDFANVQTFVVAPPVAGVKPLHLGFDWATDQDPVVYVSRSANDPMPNRLRLYISNDDRENAVTAAGGPLQFYISFITIPEPDPSDLVHNTGMNALTYDTDARAIEMKPVGDDKTTWEIVPPAPSAPLVWTLRAKNRQVLEKGSSVEVVIDAIRTVLPPFSTTVYVQSDIPGYDNVIREVHVDKADPHPGILLFDAESRDIMAGESVELTWRTMALDDLVLSYTENNRLVRKSYKNGHFALNAGYPVRPEVTTNYTLTPYTNSRKQPASSIEITVSQPDPKIVSFSADPAGPVDIDANGKGITLTWSVADASRVELNGDQILGAITKTTIFKSSEFKLEAFNRDGISVEKKIAINAKPPTINRFEVVPAAGDETPQTLTLAWDVSGATQLNIEGQAPINGNSGSITVQAKPTQSFYLIAENHDGARTKASATVQSYRDFLPGKIFKLTNDIVLEFVSFHAGGSGKYYCEWMNLTDGWPWYLDFNWSIQGNQIAMTVRPSPYATSTVHCEINAMSLTLKSSDLLAGDATPDCRRNTGFALCGVGEWPSDFGSP